MPQAPGLADGREHRYLHRVDCLWDQRHAADFAGVAAGLRALGGDGIGARRLGLLGVAHLAAHHHHFHVVRVHFVNELRRHGEPRNEDTHALVEDHLHLRADHVGDRRQQIDGERLVREVARLFDLLAQHRGVHRRAADDAKAAGVGDGGDERGGRDAAHPREKDRVLDTEEIADGCVQ